MRYCSYDFYQEEYGGNMPETFFSKLSIEASAYIKRNTYNNIEENNIPEEVKLCMCSITETLYKLEKRKGKSSESVGSWSVNYQTYEEDDKELYNILINYLLYVKGKNGESILYRGC